MTAARNAEERPALLSRITAFVSGGLVLLLVGYLIVHGVVADRPAVLEARVAAGDGWTRDGVLYVPIDVRNLGDRPAGAVVIETRAGGGEAPQTATIDFLAGGERRRIYVAVPAGADPGGASAGVVSFQEP